MIDFDQFWAEAGCAPGLSKEETEAQLRQMAAFFGQFGSGTPGPSAFPGLSPGPGVTAEQLDAWDHEHGVRLPDILRHALQRQDGGYLRDNRFRIFSLAEMAPPDEGFWEWTSYKEEEIPDRRLVIRFAEEEEFGGQYFLNYNGQGPQQEPSVFVYHHDPGDLDRCAKSVTKFLARKLEASDTPLAQSAGTGDLETITEETIDLSAVLGPSAVLEQTLARQAGALVLLTHEKTTEGERYTRTTLPEPLDTSAFGAGAIAGLRPAPTPTFALHLQPRDTQGVVQVESQRTRDGRWKNSTLRGAPIYVHFESTDRGRLEALRRLLLGKEAAARAQARQDQQDLLQQKLTTLSPEEMHAATMHIFLQMQQQFGGGRPAGMPPPADIPPEMGVLSELINEKLREAMRRSQEILAKHPVNPEVLRLLGEMMKMTGEEGAGEGE
jgi:hypothetical protein